MADFHESTNSKNYKGFDQENNLQVEIIWTISKPDSVRVSSRICIFLIIFGSNCKILAKIFVLFIVGG